VTLELRDYLDRLVARIGDRVVGAYAVGSLALGAYAPGRSDADVLAVVDGRLAGEELLAIAERCSHRALPCPARKLELVVIGAAEARAGRPDWQLNLNTGEGMDDHVGLDPAAEPRHWFVLDLALAHEHGIALSGPPAREVVAAPAPAVVQEAHEEAVEWYARNEPGPATVLAACRAWHWQETGRFIAKGEALRWAVARLGSET
jgi:hypothetical protein